MKNDLYLKAKIYQYTGIFLANKEQTDYLWSLEGIDELQHNVDSLKDVDLAYSLVVGSWQAKNGFYRPVGPFFSKKPKWLFSIVNWCSVFFLVLKGDTSKLLKKRQ